MAARGATPRPSPCTGDRWRSWKRCLASKVRSDHPDLWTSLNNLASLYQAEGRTPDALPLVESTIASGLGSVCADRRGGGQPDKSGVCTAALALRRSIYKNCGSWSRFGRRRLLAQRADQVRAAASADR